MSKDCKYSRSELLEIVSRLMKRGVPVYAKVEQMFTTFYRENEQGYGIEVGYILNEKDEINLPNGVTRSNTNTIIQVLESERVYELTKET